MCLMVSLYLPVWTLVEMFLFERLSVILVPSVELFSSVSFRIPVCSIRNSTNSSVAVGGGVPLSQIPATVMQCNPKNTLIAVRKNWLLCFDRRNVRSTVVERVGLLILGGLHSLQG